MYVESEFVIKVEAKYFVSFADRDRDSVCKVFVKGYLMRSVRCGFLLKVRYFRFFGVGKYSPF